MLRALAEIAVLADRGRDVSVDESDLARRALQVVGGMPADLRFGLWRALEFFEWSAVLRFGARFSRLDRARRLRWARWWLDNRFFPLRTLAKLLFVFVKPLHFARDPVKQAIGYPTGRLDQVKPVRQVELPAQRHQVGLDRDGVLRCQVVVVGSGAGGAVVAAELAEAGIDVVVVEKGSWFAADDLGRDPVGVMSGAYAMGGAAFALGRPGILVPYGETVGGTTTINSGTCFRLPPRVREAWRAGGLDLDDETLDADYARVERRIHVQPVPPERLGGSSAVAARGATALGLSHGPLLRNIDGCLGSATCAFGCPRNAKQSMNVTYVPAALRAGARLFSQVRVTRVLREGGRAVGVEAVSHAGRRLQVRADVVVSAAGAVSGVPLLRQSGVRSRHLGRHLTVHPASKILGLMPERVDGWLDTPQGYCIDALAGEGIMFEGAFVPPEYASITIPFVGQDLARVMGGYQNLALFGFLVSDAPNGRVRVGLGGRPMMTYWLGSHETELIRRALLVLSEVFFAAGAERVWLPLAGAEEQVDLAGARRVLGVGPLDPWRLELAAFHPLGTARAAARRADGVVRPDLECWEVPGLFVVDGGVFPSSLGVNPQLTIMAWATRAARTIADRVGVVAQT